MIDPPTKPPRTAVELLFYGLQIAVVTRGSVHLQNPALAVRSPNSVRQKTRLMMRHSNKQQGWHIVSPRRCVYRIAYPCDFLRVAPERVVSL